MYVAANTTELNLTLLGSSSYLHPLVIKVLKIFGVSAYVSLVCGDRKLVDWHEWWNVEAGGICCIDHKLGLETWDLGCAVKYKAQMCLLF